MDKTLVGRYQIIEPLGKGGFGHTFLARDSQLPGHPLCVVKQLKPSLSISSDWETAKRLFDREAKILYRLGSHDQIPQLLAHFEQDQEFYLVQEFIEGHSLDQEIVASRQLPEKEVISLLQDILTLLLFVHQHHVIHRDIKPANLIRRHRDRKIVLIDFGAVKEVTKREIDGFQQTSITVAIGSPGYMPTEQLSGKPCLNSDIYAVGILAIQGISGISPRFFPKDPNTGEFKCSLLRSTVAISPGLVKILDKMVLYDYRQRYQTATAVLQDLDLFLHPQKSVNYHTNTQIMPSQMSAPLSLDEPEGQVSLNSAFYIERQPIESDCYEAILKPAALIRIKAPRQMGKTSLMSRILYHASQQDYQTACINFQSADGEFLTNLDQFLHWFCVTLAEELHQEYQPDEGWERILGSKSKCTKFFQRYLLSEIKMPIVLGLDEVDQIFQHPEIATDFFGLLRAWHEKGKNEIIWQKLRLVIVHSKEVYIPLNINQSPFNVGLPIELPELNQSQVEDLIQRHGLTFTPEQVKQLIAMTGGHPYLVRVALYQIARGRMTLDTLLKIAPTEAGLYGDHLRRHVLNLEENPELMAAIQQVVATNEPVELKTSTAFKLRSMGLVKFCGNAVIPLCEMYRLYFRDRLF